MANQNMYQDINPESVQVGDSVYGLAGIRDMQNLFRRDQLRQEQDKQIARSNRMKDLDEAQRVATQPGLLDAAGAQNILSAGDRARAPQQVTNATDELSLKQAGTQNKFVEEMLGGLVDLAGKNPEAAQELYANMSADGIDHPLQKGLQEKLRSAGLLKPSGNPMLGNRADLSRDLPVLQSLIGSVRDKNKVLAGTASNIYKADQNLAGINRKAEATEYGADSKADSITETNTVKSQIASAKNQADYTKAINVAILQANAKVDAAAIAAKRAGAAGGSSKPLNVNQEIVRTKNQMIEQGVPPELADKWMLDSAARIAGAAATEEKGKQFQTLTQGAIQAPPRAPYPKSPSPAQATVTPPAARNAQGPVGPYNDPAKEAAYQAWKKANGK